MSKGTRGPAAVREALIEAATDLFARDGDASVRAVATAAGVNHGLVHHYFGGKAGLRAAVLDRLAAGLAQRLDVPPATTLVDTCRAAVRVTQQDPRMIKILGRALLDGAVPHQLQTNFPVVERLLALSDGHAEQTRAKLAQNMALVLGSMVFGPWIRAALGMSEQEFDDAREHAIEQGLADLEDSSR